MLPTVRDGEAAAELTHEDAPLAFEEAASLALAGAAATADAGEVDPVVVNALHWALQDGGATFPATATTPIAVRPLSVPAADGPVP